MTNVNNISAIIEFDETAFKSNVLSVIEDIKANKITSDECYDILRKSFIDNIKIGFKGFHLEGDLC